MLRRALATMLLASCAMIFSPPAQACAVVDPIGAIDQADPGKRAKALLAKMTLEEKVGQLSQYFYVPGVPSLSKPIEARIEQGGVGALLFVTDPKEINRLQMIAVERSRLKIPLLFGFDVIHGLRTIMPMPVGMAASWDPDLVERGQAVAAAEARASGLHWTFAPMVDISLDARWGRRAEGAGEDPYLGAAMAAAQVRGFQGDQVGAPGKIIAGPKHFAGYGAALGGRDYDEAEISDNQLWNVYLPPFKAAVDAGAGNIMSAYMALNGVPASGDRWLLTDVLRKQWGFKGFVVSDADAVSSLTVHGLSDGPSDAARRALKAGVNMEMISPGKPSVMPNLTEEIAAGRLSVAELDAAVGPILEAKFKMGLFDNPYVDPDKTAAVLEDPAHRSFARLAAERSAVLLKNDEGLLPLAADKTQSIALIGPLADSPRDTLGPWVFAMNRPRGVSILAALRAKLGERVKIDYVEGVRLPDRVFPSMFAAMEPKVARAPIDETAEIARAVAAAKAADVAVLVLGEGQDMNGEGASRASLSLPGRQQDLLDAVAAAGKPVIVLLMSTRPLSLGDARPQAILDLWYPGSEGGAAAANLLFGDAVPGGKLPFTWIRSAAQAPATYAALISHEPAKAHERYWDGSSAPTYPFGFGLSYSRFAYANLRVDKSSYRIGETVRVSVDLTNVGARAADEVAQLYIHQRSGSASRPVRELKGFQRIALKPGETRTLQFTLRPAELRYWSAAIRGWTQEASVFDVWVGGDSTASLAGQFAVVGR